MIPLKGNRVSISAADWRDVQKMLFEYRSRTAAAGTPARYNPAVIDGIWDGTSGLPVGSVVQAEFMAGRSKDRASGIEPVQKFRPRARFKYWAAGDNSLPESPGVMAITLTPSTRSGELVSAAIAGVAYARISFRDDDLQSNFAVPKTGSSVLHSQVSGPCQIIDRDFRDREPGSSVFGAWVQVNNARFNQPFWVQAPENGIPAAFNSGPGGTSLSQHRAGVAACVPLFQTTYTTGSNPNDVWKGRDLVIENSGVVFDIYNFFHDVAGADGDRRVLVSGHHDGAQVLGWSCSNNGSATFRTASQYDR